jgi:hypothetical protein
LQATATTVIEGEDNEAQPVDENHNDTQDEVIGAPTPPVTRSGRATNPLARLIETINMVKATELNAIAAEYKIALMAVEEKYYDAMRELGELALVGAAGENYVTTEQLKPMKYDEAMATEDAEGWDKAVKEEHDRMLDNTVWEVQMPEQVPEDATVMRST